MVGPNRSDPSSKALSVWAATIQHQHPDWISLVNRFLDIYYCEDFSLRFGFKIMSFNNLGTLISFNWFGSAIYRLHLSFHAASGLGWERLEGQTKGRKSQCGMPALTQWRSSADAAKGPAPLLRQLLTDSIRHRRLIVTRLTSLQAASWLEAAAPPGEPSSPARSDCVRWTELKMLNNLLYFNRVAMNEMAITHKHLRCFLTFFFLLLLADLVLH